MTASDAARRVWRWGLPLLGVLACALMLLAVAGVGKAKASPSASPFLGEIASTEVPGGLNGFTDAAADRSSGNVYVALEKTIDKLSPYGDFILAFPGEFRGAQAVAVEPSSGDVYVFEHYAYRVQKLDSSGHFLRMFGLDVNKAKAEAVQAKEAKGETPSAAELAEANLCVAGEECQAGREGSGPGAFEWMSFGPKMLAVGGPSGKESVYVGGEGRIQVFNSAGEFVEQLSLSSISSTRVSAIAADSSGDVFFANQWTEGVHMAETNGGGALELSATMFDSSSSAIQALAVDSGTLYVADSSPSARVLVYEVSKPAEVPAQFGNAEPGQLSEVYGLTVNAGAVYVLNREEGVESGIYRVNFYGSLTALEGAYGSPPPIAPAVDFEAVQAGPEEATATLEAQVNPELRETTYQFEYGTEPCSLGGCTKVPASPTPLGSLTKTDHQVTATASGLQVGVAYHYRLTVANAAGTVIRPEGVFRIGVSTVSGPTGLPDGRVYEMVSPAGKFGNEVAFLRPAFAAADGQGVMFGATGAITANSTNATIKPEYVSQRTSHGWVTRSTVPLPAPGPNSEEENVESSTFATVLDPSTDLSHLLFRAREYTYPPYVGPPDEAGLANNLYLEGPDPLAEPEWVGRSHIEGFPGGSPVGFKAEVAGNSPDLKVVYFLYDNGTGNPGNEAEPSALLPGASISGLYEYRDGVLSDAGVLPGGETSAGLAVPAIQNLARRDGSSSESRLASAAAYSSQVSADGLRIVFTREDEAGALELYAHLTTPGGAQSSVLVSGSQLPGHAGEPAPHGPVAFASTLPMTSDSLNEEHSEESEPGPRSYAFISPDGSHVFFQSADRLAEAAPEDGAVKTYDFDLDTGTLEYLPGLTGSIVTVSPDGLSLVFESTSSSPLKLERWTAGPGGGSVSQITVLPAPPRNSCRPVLCVGPAFTSSDGKVVVFATEAPIPGFNDGGTHYQLSNPGEQPEGSPLPNIAVFRYDSEEDNLRCVSCPPKGTAPTGNAILSRVAYTFNFRGASGGEEEDTPGRSVSADGGRVFFETRMALVPQDVNGVGDVYEWENGSLFLISSGHSLQSSYMAGVSESGADAFIETSEGIAPGDTDGAYDVYDARIPRPGDNPPPEALPCEGAVCQGPPSVPNLLGLPASETFNGQGNLTPVLPRHVGGKSLTRAQKLARALKACRHGKHGRKRKRCERRALHRYATKAAGNRHHNGRGN